MYFKLLLSYDLSVNCMKSNYYSSITVHLSLDCYLNSSMYSVCLKLLILVSLLSAVLNLVFVCHYLSLIPEQLLGCQCGRLRLISRGWAAAEWITNGEDP